MTVRVVTDSASDIPFDVAQELGITIVPVYVIFGDEVYRDRLDISEDEFYRRLINGSVHPTTSAPSPKDFADAYNKLAAETDEIISIHLTAKLSSVYNSALLGAQLIGRKCRIEVIDSMSMSVGLGLSVIATARETRTGGDLEEVARFARRTIVHVHGRSMANTLKYAVRSGRLNKAYGLLGTILGVKPILGIRDGKAFLAGLARTKLKGLECLYEFAKGIPGVEEIALAYTTEYGDAEYLAERLKQTFSQTPISIMRVGSGIGAYGGPGSVGIAVRQTENADNTVL